LLDEIPVSNVEKIDKIWYNINAERDLWKNLF